MQSLVKHVASNNRYQTTLNLSRGFEQSNIKSLFNALQSNQYITCLSLESNNLKLSSINALAKFLQNNKTIKTLILNKTDLNRTKISILCVALINNTTLQTLCLNNNNLKSDSAFEISKLLKVNSTITRLALNKNKIGNIGVKYLANNNLTLLDLNNNNISLEGIRYLANMLDNEECRLISLYLIANDIGDEGALLLANALKTNDRLQYLYIKYSNITNNGLNYLIEMLEQNCTLLKVGIRRPEYNGNLLDSIKLQEISKLVKQNHII